MRHTLFKSRWHTPRRPYSGDWRHNPWINNAQDNSSPARIGVADDITQERQQKAAIRVWEDEGGSIRTDGHVLR
jgi:hypothetical protein